MSGFKVIGFEGGSTPSSVTWGGVALLRPDGVVLNPITGATCTKASFDDMIEEGYVTPVPEHQLAEGVFGKILLRTPDEYVGSVIYKEHHLKNKDAAALEIWCEKKCRYYLFADMPMLDRFGERAATKLRALIKLHSVTWRRDELRRAADILNMPPWVKRT